MNIPFLHAGETKLLLQVKKDLQRFIGYNEFAIPDRNSELYRAAPDLPWGKISPIALGASLGFDEDSLQAKGFPWKLGFNFSSHVAYNSKHTPLKSERNLEEIVLIANFDLNETFPWYSEMPLAVKTALIIIYVITDRRHLFRQKDLLKELSNRNTAAASTHLDSIAIPEEIIEELAERILTCAIKPEHKAKEKL